MIWKKDLVVFSLVILLAMLINVFHPYLWGPDEPRDAEIARETYISGNYAIPHFCGVPFVEKTPLYYNLVSLSFSVANTASPGAARLISALFGCIMLAGIFWFCCRWFDTRCGLLAVAILIVMPQFYRTAHWILLDIGIGAFCVIAFCAFSLLAFGKLTDKNKLTGLACYVFYLSSAGAFWTKGIIGIFHIAVVIAAFIILTRRWDLVRQLLRPLPLLTFLLPMLLWVYLLYREGGIYYLHEHFINNTIGRFQHINLTLNGSPIKFTDVGNKSPWYFYLKRLPEMCGPVLVFLPFIIWDGLRRFKLLPRHWTANTSANDGKSTTMAINPFKVFFNDWLNCENIHNNRKDLRLFLLLWAFLPVLLLSIPAIKEVTYIIPSYAAIAILSGIWLQERLETVPSSVGIPDAVWYMLIIVPIALCSEFFAVSTTTFLIFTIVWLTIALLYGIISAISRHYTRVAFIALAIALGVVIICNNPEIMNKTRLSRKCYLGLARDVWLKVGNNNLYVFGRSETLRGSIPFYGNRQVMAFNDFSALAETLDRNPDDFVIMTSGDFVRFVKSRLNADQTTYKTIELPPYRLDENYVLFSKKYSLKKPETISVVPQ